MRQEFGHPDHDLDRRKPYKRLLDGSALYQQGRSSALANRDSDEVASLVGSGSRKRRYDNAVDPVFVEDDDDQSHTTSSDSDSDSDSDSAVQLPPALRQRVAQLRSQRKHARKRRRKVDPVNEEPLPSAEAKEDTEEMKRKEHERQQAEARRVFMDRVEAEQQAEIQQHLNAENGAARGGNNHQEEDEAIDVPVQYVPLHDTRWQLDDEDAKSPHCFLCAYPGITTHGGTRVQRMMQIISDQYGKISNEMLANAIQAYYNKNVRFFERRPDEAFPPWSKRMIIDHIEKHCPTALTMNNKTVRDMNLMIDVIQEQSLCVLDADNNKNVDSKNAKLLLQLVKERRACMREVERLSSIRR